MIKINRILILTKIHLKPAVIIQILPMMKTQLKTKMPVIKIAILTKLTMTMKPIKIKIKIQLITQIIKPIVQIPLTQTTQQTVQTIQTAQTTLIKTIQMINLKIKQTILAPWIPLASVNKITVQLNNQSLYLSITMLHISI